MGIVGDGECCLLLFLFCDKVNHVDEEVELMIDMIIYVRMRSLCERTCCFRLS